ncbi:hypothetical protein BT93_L5658 [Corymbia citriodora subsp. variegata]|uniref:F-box protein n=1 Tax=Corymbia citriodora subsp. variegata TaxID=360336 RepID=A0A8T0CWB5_CORYI|nr:hypothetical protein BT93_L5658 [Corymbia citriodora subsp. variegata]
MLEDRDKGKLLKVWWEVTVKGLEDVASPSAEASNEVSADMLEDRDKGKQLKALQEVIWKWLEASSAEASNEASKDAEMVENQDKEKLLKAPWEVIQKGLKEHVEQFQLESASDRDKVLFVSSDGGRFELGMSHRSPIEDRFRRRSLRENYARHGHVERNLATVELGGLAVAGRVELLNFNDGSDRPCKLRKLKVLDHLSLEASQGHDAIAVSNDGKISEKDGIKSEDAGILEDPIKGKLCPKTTYLIDLADDILSFEIFDRLSDHDLEKLGSVSKDIKRLSFRDELWKPRYEDEFGESLDLPKKLSWKQKFSLSMERKIESARSSGPNKRKRESDYDRLVLAILQRGPQLQSGRI